MPRADRLLHRALFPLLMIGYAFVVAGLTAVAATWESRPITGPGDIPWWSHTIALAVIVATWVPVSTQLDRSVHQLAFGHRDDSYELTDRIFPEISGNIGPAAATTLATTLALPYVEVEANGKPLTTHGTPPDGAALVTIPLIHQNHRLGTLRASARRRDDRLSAADIRLLEYLAHQVATTLALQHSREQLVTAREEERRRIRRDLHDGLAPTLASLALHLGVLRQTLRADPDGAERLAADLRTDVRQATADIRRLVYELRPPMLDEFGLVDALRNLRPLDGPARTVEAQDPMPALPAAVEVAVYRIAAEALHNVARHARASHCTVRLAATGERVTLTVTDDGRGLPGDYLAGVGHHSMRERAAEVGGTIEIGHAPGGGTRITADFPSPAEMPGPTEKDA